MDKLSSISASSLLVDISVHSFISTVASHAVVIVLICTPYNVVYACQIKFCAHWTYTSMSADMFTGACVHTHALKKAICFLISSLYKGP